MGRKLVAGLKRSLEGLFVDMGLLEIGGRPGAGGKGHNIAAFLQGHRRWLVEEKATSTLSHQEVYSRVLGVGRRFCEITKKYACY